MAKPCGFVPKGQRSRVHLPAEFPPVRHLPVGLFRHAGKQGADILGFTAPTVVRSTSRRSSRSGFQRRFSEGDAPSQARFVWLVVLQQLPGRGHCASIGWPARCSVARSVMGPRIQWLGNADGLALEQRDALGGYLFLFGEIPMSVAPGSSSWPPCQRHGGASGMPLRTGTDLDAETAQGHRVLLCLRLLDPGLAQANIPWVSSTQGPPWAERRLLITDLLDDSRRYLFH